MDPLCFYQRLTRKQLHVHCHLQLQQVKSYHSLRANIRCACCFKATLAALRKRLAGCDSSGVCSAGVGSPVMTTADWLGSGACPDDPAIASVCVGYYCHCLRIGKDIVNRNQSGPA